MVQLKVTREATSHKAFASVKHHSPQLAEPAHAERATCSREPGTCHGTQVRTLEVQSLSYRVIAEACISIFWGLCLVFCILFSLCVCFFFSLLVSDPAPSGLSVLELGNPICLGQEENLADSTWVGHLPRWPLIHRVHLCNLEKASFLQADAALNQGTQASLVSIPSFPGSGHNTHSSMWQPLSTAGPLICGCDGGRQNHMVCPKPVCGETCHPRNKNRSRTFHLTSFRQIMLQWGWRCFVLAYSMNKSTFCWQT